MSKTIPKIYQNLSGQEQLEADQNLVGFFGLLMKIDQRIKTEAKKTVKITELQITPIKPNNGLIAFASVVVDGNLYLGSIGIHSRIDGSGYRLTYPTKPIGGRDLNIYHPINKQASEAIEQAVISKYKDVMKENNDRYSSPNLTTK